MTYFGGNDFGLGILKYVFPEIDSLSVI